MRRWRWRWPRHAARVPPTTPRQYFTDYVRRWRTDMPMLVMLEERDGYYAAGRMPPPIR